MYSIYSNVPQSVRDYIRLVFIDNEFFHQYMAIIDRAIAQKRKRLPRKHPNRIYYEGHHMIPKSICSSLESDKNNIVLLTGAEHFTAHRLLTKFCRHQKDASKMALAWRRMSHISKDHEDRYIVTPEEYEEIKQTYANIGQSEQHIKKRTESLQRANQREDVRLKRSKAQLGNTKSKGSRNRLGGKHTDEWKKQNSSRMQGNSHTLRMKWVFDPINNKSKMVSRSQYQTYLNDGWIKGRGGWCPGLKSYNISDGTLEPFF